MELCEFFFRGTTKFQERNRPLSVVGEERMQGAEMPRVAAYHHARQGMIAMRVHNIIAIAAAFVFGFGVKGFLSSPPANAGHDAQTSAGLNVLQMHLGYPDMKNMPVQKMNDSTFVFSDGR